MGVNLASWLMCCWSLGTMWLMSNKRYKAAWWSSVFSQFGWIAISCFTQLWGMAFYSAVMIFIGIKALRKLRIGDTQ